MLALSLVLILVCSSLQFHAGRVSGQEINVVVMTADQLKTEVKAQVTAALVDSLPAICSCHGGNGSSGPLTTEQSHLKV